MSYANRLTCAMSYANRLTPQTIPITGETVCRDLNL